MLHYRLRHYMKCIICNKKGFSKLYKKFNYQLVKCKSCAFVCINSLPTRLQLDNYYKKFEYKTGFVNEFSIRQDGIRTLTKLKSLGYNNGSLLDIGCGTGFFLDEARKAGWNAQGIDTSKITTNYGINKLKLKLFRGDFLKYKFLYSKFRVITLLQVIEHFIDPKPTLNKIYKLLESNGILCVATPNIESHLAKVLKGDFNYIIPPEHVSYYSPRTLKRILEETDFKLLKTYTWGYPSDLGAIIKRKIKGKKDHASNKNIFSNSENNISSVKKIKSILFDSIFCRIFFSVLNYNCEGSMVEIYATKK